MPIKRQIMCPIANLMEFIAIKLDMALIISSRNAFSAKRTASAEFIVSIERKEEFYKVCIKNN